MFSGNPAPNPPISSRLTVVEAASPVVGVEGGAATRAATGAPHLGQKRTDSEISLLQLVQMGKAQAFALAAAGLATGRPAFSHAS